MVYWLKKNNKGYDAEFMGKVDKVDERKIRRLFSKKGITFLKTTGIAVVKKWGDNRVVVELYENGLEKGMTDRIQEWKARVIMKMIEHAKGQGGDEGGSS